MILGDFNCNLLEAKANLHKTKLLSLFEEYQYKQLIEQPTRITKASESLIDHIITNMPQRIYKSGVCHVSISDHSLIYTVRRLALPRGLPRIVEIRSFKNFDKGSFLNELTEAPWDAIESFEDPNEKWSAFNSIFINILNLHAPVKTRYLYKK